MRSALPTLLAVLPFLAGTGCQMNERMTGTAGGALAGGVLGGVAAGTLGGVLIGTAGGALAGYLIGDYLSDQRERCMTPQGGACGGGGYAGGACGVPDAYTSATAAQTASVPPAPAPTAPGSSYAARAAYERGRTAATAEEAKAAYAESIRLDPTRPEPWNALALHALVTGDRETARAHLGRALSLDPSYAPARLNLQQLDRGP